MAAESSHGLEFQVYDTVATTWGAWLGNWTSVSFSSSKDTFEVTSLTDTAWKEFISGLAEFEISGDLNYDPTAHTDLRTTLASAGTELYRIHWPDSDATNNARRFMFYAFVTSFDATGSAGDKLTASVSLKGTGALSVSDAT